MFPLDNSVFLLLDQIRNKASHYRSLEEKQWVALDILVNREKYKALSVLENEELQLNDEYKTEHREEDVARILQLPHEIQLALPHLKSPAEIDAHKLLATYTLEHGDAYFAKVDEQSQDQFFATASSRAQSTPVSVEPSQASLYGTDVATASLCSINLVFTHLYL